VTVYSEAELAMLTPDEQEALLAEEQASETPAVEDEASAETVVADAEPVVDAIADTDETTVEEPAVADDTQPEPVAEFSPEFRAAVPEGLDDRLAELDQQEEAIEARFDAGEIERDEMRRQIKALDSERTDLKIAAAQSKWAETQNAESRTQRWQWEQERFFGSEKNAETYKDPVMVAMLDAQVKQLANAAENKNRPAGWFLEEADRLIRGRFQGVSAPTPSVPPVERKPQPTVRTLSNIPAAAPAPVGDDVMGKIGTLEGEDLEKYLARMSPADVEKLLRAA